MDKKAALSMKTLRLYNLVLLSGEKKKRMKKDLIVLRLKPKFMISKLAHYH